MPATRLLPASDRWCRRLSSIALLAALAAPATVRAQCAVCGNPAFLTGDNDLARTWLPPGPRGVRLRAALYTTMQRYADIYTGTRRLPSAEKSGVMFTPAWRLDVWTTTAVVGVDLPAGTGLDVVLPLPMAAATRAAEGAFGVDPVPVETSWDRGVGDVELRLRQRLRGLLRGLPAALPDLIFSAGLVAPTGRFIPKGLEGEAPDGYASLGRGVWWSTWDLDLVGRIGTRVGYVAGAAVRLPHTTITNNGFLFRWGPEVRAHATVTADPLPKRLGVGLGVEWLARDGGEERIFADTPIEPFANGGGHWLTVIPSLRLRLRGDLAVHAAARIQAWRRVRGMQPVPGIGWTVGLAWWAS